MLCPFNCIVSLHETNTKSNRHSLLLRCLPRLLRQPQYLSRLRCEPRHRRNRLEWNHVSRIHLCIRGFEAIPVSQSLVQRCWAVHHPCWVDRWLFCYATMAVDIDSRSSVWNRGYFDVFVLYRISGGMVCRKKGVGVWSHVGE